MLCAVRLTSLLLLKHSVLVNTTVRTTLSLVIMSPPSV